jgi:hypothetical protein
MVVSDIQLEAGRGGDARHLAWGRERGRRCQMSDSVG